jgi:thiosulfate/3-mercaptopyruvate sulfurtransferase
MQLTTHLTTLISTDLLARHLADPDWAVIDCRFDLARPEWGQAQYRAGHIRGAVYAHLDCDLSGPKTGTNGRHPLPGMGAFMARLGGWGVGRGAQVIVYDQLDGMYASRLWWMLRYLGHTAVALLDGGWAKWEHEGRPAQSGDQTRAPAEFGGAPQPGLTVTADEVDLMRRDANRRMLDAREPERYRGETEPIDRVAGHIPGAVNYWFKNNVNPDGTFRTADEVRARLQAILGAMPAGSVAVYCGSGVAACQDILAAEYAGLAGMKLYPGSWSEWSADPARPVAKAEDSQQT